MNSKQDTYFEHEFWLIHHTENAFLVSSDEDETDKEWIPKAACDFNEEDIPVALPTVFKLEVKERMLLKKGFL